MVIKTKGQTMTTVEITIEFLTHCLSVGSEQCRDVSEFDKDKDGGIIWRQSWWHAALAKTIEVHGLSSVDPAQFLFDPTVTAETARYRRKYGYNKYREHEAILPGTRVTFRAAISGNLTVGAVADIMTCMGRFVGLTPYGHKLGYGKFKVIKVEPVKEGTSDETNISSPPAISDHV